MVSNEFCLHVNTKTCDIHERNFLSMKVLPNLDLLKGKYSDLNKPVCFVCTCQDKNACVICLVNYLVCI